ncbi:MAG: hypothetical protein NC548_24610 [Lachnospiraceae bacterium]|nr:hypothetical protein [Lachnospiraceae bacterium]
MKKRMLPFIAVLTLLLMVMCGCGSGDDPADSGLSKSEWTGRLGDKFGYNAYESSQDFYTDVNAENEYYDEIQACAEWMILPEKGAFHPDEKATWQYAIETAVRAIGIDKLNKSDVAVEVSEDNLIDFFTSEIARVEEVDLDREVTETDASLILEYAYAYASELTLVQNTNYVYNEGVIETDPEEVTLKGDGVTAMVPDGNLYKAGDVIYVKPSVESAAYGMCVQSVEGNELIYEPADMEDIYQELQITGTFEATILNVEPAEGVTISRIFEPKEQEFDYAAYLADARRKAVPLGKAETDDTDMLQTDVQMNSNHVKFSWAYEGISLETEISDISVTSDVDFGILSGLKKADVTLFFQNAAKAEYKGDHVSKQIPLGNVEVLLGSTPLTARFSLVANLGFDGEIVLTYSSQVVTNVNYSKGNGLAKSVNNNDAKCDLHAEATVTVEPTVKADICCLGRSLANAKIISGVVAIATVDMDLLGGQPACTDVFAYVPLRWAINEDGCVMTDISGSLKASDVVWDSGNSPITLELHWEDGVLVAVCTRGEKVKTEKVDENGEPFDEYKEFDFEEIVFGFIKVSSQNLYLSQGETMAIGFTSLPDGYSASELRYEPENAAVCSAGGGYVTAAGPGSTTLFISTADEKYSIYVTVTVEAEYNDTSGFQSL